MKHLFKYSFLWLSLLIASCSNEELLSDKADGEDGVISIHVTDIIPNTSTRALALDDPATCKANQVQLLIFKNNSNGTYLYDSEDFITSAYTEETTNGTVQLNGTQVSCQIITRIFRKKVKLAENETYRIMALAYEAADAQTTSPPYTLNLVAGITSFADTQLSITSSTEVDNPKSAPELFFTNGCKGNDDKTDITTTTAANGIKGTLYRVVGGFRMTITNIPEDIVSLRLMAERISVTQPMTGTFGFITPVEYAYECCVANITPTEGSALFDLFLLSAQESYFYVDAISGDGTFTRYLIKCEDTDSGIIGPTGIKDYIVKDNQFRILKNRLIRLQGPFENLRTGNIQIDIDWENDVFGGYIE